jgi:hypothetical protein
MHVGITVHPGDPLSGTHPHVERLESESPNDHEGGAWNALFYWKAAHTFHGCSGFVLGEASGQPTGRKAGRHSQRR